MTISELMRPLMTMMDGENCSFPRAMPPCQFIDTIVTTQVLNDDGEGNPPITQTSAVKAASKVMQLLFLGEFIVEFAQILHREGNGFSHNIT